MIDISIMRLETIEFIFNQDEKEFTVLRWKWNPHFDHRLFLGFTKQEILKPLKHYINKQQRLLKISLI